MDDPAALVAFIGKLAVEAFQHRIQRLLDLEKQRFVVGSHEQCHVAIGADGSHADRLESDVLHGKTIEQPQPIRIEALAIRREYRLDVETVLGVGLGIKMENGLRLVDDLLTAAADEVREIIILRQTLPPRAPPLPPVSVAPVVSSSAGGVGGSGVLGGGVGVAWGAGDRWKVLLIT